MIVVFWWLFLVIVSIGLVGLFMLMLMLCRLLGILV